MLGKAAGRIMQTATMRPRVATFFRDEEECREGGRSVKDASVEPSANPAAAAFRRQACEPAASAPSRQVTGSARR